MAAHKSGLQAPFEFRVPLVPARHAHVPTPVIPLEPQAAARRQLLGVSTATTAKQPPLTATTFVRHVGTGGFGTVDVRQDSRTQQWFVRKEFNVHASALSYDAYAKEKRANDLVSRHDDVYDTIVKVREFHDGRDGKGLAIDYELCSTDLFGFTFGEDKAQTGAIGLVSEASLLNIIADGLRGLRFLHEEVGLCHHDIKANNLMLTFQFGEACGIKIIDLGLAEELTQPGGLTRISGTLPFLAPEIWFDDEVVDQAIDIFAFGLTIYEMLEYETLVPDVKVIDNLVVLRKQYRQFWSGQRSSRSSWLQPEPKGKNIRNFKPSEDLCDIVCMMLILDGRKRPSADELLQHQALQATRARLNVNEAELRKELFGTVMKTAEKRMMHEVRNEVVDELKQKESTIRAQQRQIQDLREKLANQEAAEQLTRDRAIRAERFMADQRSLRRHIDDAQDESAARLIKIHQLERDNGGLRELMHQIHKEVPLARRNDAVKLYGQSQQQQQAQCSTAVSNAQPAPGARTTGLSRICDRLTLGAAAATTTAKKPVTTEDLFGFLSGFSQSDLLQSVQVAQPQQQQQPADAATGFPEFDELSSINKGIGPIAGGHRRTIGGAAMQVPAPYRAPTKEQEERMDREKEAARLKRLEERQRQEAEVEPPQRQGNMTGKERAREQRFARKRLSEDDAAATASDSKKSSLTEAEAREYRMAMRHYAGGDNEERYAECERIREKLNVPLADTVALMALIKAYARTATLDWCRNSYEVAEPANLPAEEQAMRRRVAGHRGAELKAYDVVFLGLCLTMCPWSLGKMVFQSVTGRSDKSWEDGAIKDARQFLKLKFGPDHTN